MSHFMRSLLKFTAHMLFLVIAISLFLWISVAQAQTSVYTLMTSTPDITVTGTATLSVFDSRGGPARWISIKNDCGDTLYFALNRSGSGANDYALRLEGNESFTAPVFIRRIFASPDSTDQSSCTFTLILAE